MKKDKRKLQVGVDGPWTFHCIYPVLNAALAGFCLACMPEVLATAHIASGRLEPVLTNWCPTFRGLYIFHAIDGSLPRRSHWQWTPCATAVSAHDGQLADLKISQHLAFARDLLLTSRA